MNIFGFFIDWQNYNRSLAEGFPLQELIASTDIEPALKAKLQRTYPDGTCYLWGADVQSDLNQNTWDRMHEGDLVVGYKGWEQPRCAGRLAATTESREIAEAVWGGPDFGLIFFLTDFKALDPDEAQLVYDYIHRVRNFRRVSDDNLRTIRNDFGSVAAFTDTVLSAKPISRAAHGQENLSMHDRMQRLHQYVTSQGFVFQPWQLATYVAALQTKPFVILAGVSGTGKSQLPQLVAKATGSESALIPVRPDWTDSSDLLGYLDIQQEFQAGGFLKVLDQANNNKDKHYVCLIDEMNLARVEHYFAEVLSHIEAREGSPEAGYRSKPLLSRVLDEGDEYADVRLTPNFAVVGTVNMDESTYTFSRKVLDRAFTLELSDVDLSQVNQVDAQKPLQPTKWDLQLWYPRAVQLGEIPDVLEVPEVKRTIAALQDVNRILVGAQLQVGYRSRDEIALFLLNARDIDESFVTSSGDRVDPLDIALMMKILPRIAGGSAVSAVVSRLLCWAANDEIVAEHDAVREADEIRNSWKLRDRETTLKMASYPRTAARLCIMWDRLEREGFTAFWL